jgi:hypothetical protein
MILLPGWFTLPPPGQNATASEDQARQARTNDRTGTAWKGTPGKTPLTNGCEIKNERLRAEIEQLRKRRH